MSGTVRFKVEFRGRRRRDTLPGSVPVGPAAGAPTEAPSTEAAPTTPGTITPARPSPTRAARMLALAYFVERLVEEGKLRDYSEAARALGVSRPRMTQVMALRWLPPWTQGQVLLGQTGVSERRLRSLARGVI